MTIHLFCENYDQVVSDKQLVKHLQKEVARLEAELRTPEPLSEKDYKIQQVLHHHLLSPV